MTILSSCLLLSSDETCYISVTMCDCHLTLWILFTLCSYFETLVWKKSVDTKSVTTNYAAQFFLSFPTVNAWIKEAWHAVKLPSIRFSFFCLKNGSLNWKSRLTFIDDTLKSSGVEPLMQKFTLQRFFKLHAADVSEVAGRERHNKLSSSW